ncbi:tyrosine-type recombinase/integrase [Thauera sp. CAU 1555]|uniref:Tyrosine-type recombinase/integrase n=1 Tax=Thauera sedimentorum TaxID=2767595 RepID=A0ABR9B639_9RHOO|nr:integrase arm-type DNA-binding domain-containing protein [Thauera sedimentorum]MBC9070813.1 tyrosine-type recombinase/integrase [Thauera sedimentorum]MBD8501732.1 tyrosine-type recombinase/integrase [Thauera sedimentorum]
MPTPTALTILLEVADQNRLTSDEFKRSLNARKVLNAKAGDGATKLADGGGLTLYIPPSGAKAWRYRYRLQGKEQTLTIGAYPEVSLECARIAHRGARWLVARGVHPRSYIEDEVAARTAREQAANEHTFKAVAKRWMAATASHLAPRTARHREAMLEKHVLGALGDRAVHEITRKELHGLLTALDPRAPVTARYCRGYINQIFEYAVDGELVQANPTPRSRVLANASTRKEKPRKALPVGRLGEFLMAVEDAPSTAQETKSALRLLVMTWCRTSEVTGARWEEFSLDDAVWLIPAARMKGGEEHRVFLSRQVVELLRALGPKTEGPVFRNRKNPNEPMHRMTLTNWRKRWGFGDVMDIHGLRATASTWANESGRYRPDVIEVALAHKEADRVRAAYNRAEFSEGLRALWQDWSDLCDRKLAEAREKSKGRSTS